MNQKNLYEILIGNVLKNTFQIYALEKRNVSNFISYADSRITKLGKSIFQTIETE